MKFSILDLLLPRETKFYELLKSQADMLVEGCKIFRGIILNLKEMNEDELRLEIKKVKECELKGDEIEEAIIKQLNDTFITPFDREDIHMIAVNLDTALDMLTSTANKIETYNITSLPNNVSNFAEIIVEIAEILRKILAEMEQKKSVDESIKAMHKLENNADYLFHISVNKLFRKEKKDPVELIKYKELFENLEGVVDSIDHIGKMIRRVTIKQG